MQTYLSDKLVTVFNVYVVLAILSFLMKTLLNTFSVLPS